MSGGWIAAASCGSGTPTANVTAPGPDAATMAGMVRYLESSGLTANGAAGIVGNAEQESSLNPTESDGAGGGGLWQWNAGWYQQMASYASSHGQSPTSAGGQLLYLVYDLKTSYQKLWGELNSASSSGQAATAFETTYELCSGVVGYMQVKPGSLCMDPKRQQYAQDALQAAGGSHSSSASVLVSATPNGTCNASYPLTGSIAGYTNPFDKASGIVWERTDQGVDATMRPGSPLLALAPSKVEMIVPDFYAGQPAIIFDITAGPLAGKWWYWSEEIQPTVAAGQTVNAGQVVATFAPSGTGIEIGWWTPNGGYPLAHTTTGYSEGSATPAGGAFRYLLQALGANPGSGAGMSSGPTMGSSHYP